MTRYRAAAKVDAAQHPLVKALRTAGIDVWSIRFPCDLLVRFWCLRHQTYCWQPLEVKTVYGKNNPQPRLDSRQKAQQFFLRETDTPIVTDFDNAWVELNKRHALGRVDTTCILKSLKETSCPPLL